MYLLIIFYSFLTITSSQITFNGFNVAFPPIQSSIEQYCYRSFDGSYNNIQNPTWGTPETNYARFLENSYSDGKHAYPRSVSGEELTNPRSISLEVFPDIKVNDLNWTLVTLMWGQLIAHDMSLTDGVPQTSVNNIECCTKDGQYVPSSNPRCVPINLPSDDPYFIPENRKCMNFVRTKASINEDCPSCSYEPKTSVTAYIDLSPIYGLSKAEADTLRSFKNGQLLSISVGNKEYPPTTNTPGVCTLKNIPKNYCFVTGDIRINQNIQLSLIQIVLLRAHNQIADTLCNKINTHWDDERCYQETRRILIALAQQITYNQFLVFVIGKQNMIDKKIYYTDPTGYINDYDPSVNPSVLNEHATAAYRLYHSSIQGYLRTFYSSRNESFSLMLSDWYDNPSILLQGDEELKLAIGLATQAQGRVDRFIDSAVSQFLFIHGILGLDLLTLDITRSRDHGLGTYVSALKACGLSSPKSFQDLEKFIRPEYVQLLQKVYKNVEDVELIVAGPLEELLLPVGIITGPTFNCIIKEQFYRSRVGDRFFYESGTQPCPFTLEQLKSIRGVTMASLICNHVEGFETIQGKAFKQISDENPLVKCDSLPIIDLSLWAEAPK